MTDTFDIEVGGFPGAPGIGTPGANVMAIGLFMIASGLSIPGGTDAVRTAGHSVNGVGIADYVADAAADGAYVAAHPKTSFTSANGRGFRLVIADGPNDAARFGLVGDTSALVSGSFNGTNNAAALAEADGLLGNGGWLHFPQRSGAYRVNAYAFTSGRKITGDGWHENPGTVGVTTYIGIQQFPGSVLCFDADVAGLSFVAFTDNASNSPAYEYQSSYGSGASDIMLYGGGGVGITAHGLTSYVRSFFDNVRVENFAGNGVQALGDGSGTSAQYGNTALAAFRSVISRNNKLHGFYSEGSNSSVITWDACDAAGNGGVGFLNKGPFGDRYGGCHAASNNASYGTPAGFSAAQRTKVTADWAGLSDHNAGSFVTTVGGAPHVFTACYTELGFGGKAEILAPATIIGGILSADLAHTANSTAVRLNGPNFLNLSKLYSDSTGIIEIAKGHLDLTWDEGSGYNAPSTGGRFQWTAALGLMLGGVGSSYDLGFRNAAAVSVMLVPHNGTVPWFPDAVTTDNGYQVGGTKVVGARGAAVTDAVAAAAAPTQAEFNALVTQFNALLARARAHGLIA